MNEMEKAIEQRLNDETWDRRMASQVLRKARPRKNMALAAAALMLLSLGLGYAAWQQQATEELDSSQEMVPYVFSDELVSDGEMELMASGYVFE
ncbi:MAG: hypothetical protein RH862_15710 [Leptospiraceae bacterium]